MVFVGVIVQTPPIHLLIFRRVETPRRGNFTILRCRQPKNLLFVRFRQASCTQRSRLHDANEMVSTHAGTVAVRNGDFHRRPQDIVRRPHQLPAANNRRNAQPIDFLRTFRFFVRRIRNFVPTRTRGAIVATLKNVTRVTLARPIRTCRQVAGAHHIICIVQRSNGRFQQVFVRFRQFYHRGTAVLRHHTSDPPIQPNGGTLFQSSDIDHHLHHDHATQHWR